MRLARVVLNVVVSLIVCAAVSGVAFMVVGPRFGWETHVVLSGSMEPALMTGGIIVTTVVPIEDVASGDIVTFDTGKRTVTHRVINVTQREGATWFQTKGDANNAPDDDLVSSTSGKMRRVALHVPYVGYAASILKGRTAFVLLVGIPALVLIGMLAREAWAAARELRRRADRGGADG